MTPEDRAYRILDHVMPARGVVDMIANEIREAVAAERKAWCDATGFHDPEQASEFMQTLILKVDRVFRLARRRATGIWA